MLLERLTNRFSTTLLKYIEIFHINTKEVTSRFSNDKTINLKFLLLN
jgi:hypothetical protein